MAPSSTLQFIVLSFLLSISLPFAFSSPKPKALILPVTKDAKTLQYVTHLEMGTPLSLKQFVIDIGGKHLWMDCNDGSYKSSTYRKSFCGSAQCSVAKATCGGGCLPGNLRPGCSNETCSVLSENTVRGGFENGEVSRDVISLQSTDGKRAQSHVLIPDFIFACANAWDMRNESLATGSNGMIGFGRESIGFPLQISSLFGGSFRRKFAVCLPSNSSSKGVIFLGESPYIFNPFYNTSKDIDVTSRLTYTRLYINTIFTGSSTVIRGPPSPDYFVKVTSIMVNRKPIQINSKLLEFHQNGTGGTKISTVEPYGKLETSVYKSLVNAFEEEMKIWNVTKAQSVAPFTNCYTNLGNVGVSGLGIAVPDIAFVFENNKNVYWEMYGANTMVEVSPDVMCFAFLDAGEASFVTTPIVIGAHQMQDNLLQFDLSSNWFGFSSSLLFDDVECSNFKF